MIAELRITDLITAGAAFLVVWTVLMIAALLWSIRRSREEQRMHRRLELLQEDVTTRELRLWHEGREARTRVPHSRKEMPLSQRFRRALDEAGWDVAPAAAVLLVLAACAAVAMGVLVLVKSAPLAAVAAVAVVLVFVALLRQRMARRQARFEGQLVDALALAARSLRSGHPLVGAFRLIAEEVDDPVGGLFARICQQQAMGVSLEQAMWAEARQSFSADLRLFTTTVVIQLRSGGNLANMMERLAFVIRDRTRLGRQVRALTAQTQLSKRVLLALPFLLFVVLYLIKPDYLRPLYTTSTGRWLLVAAAVGMVLGAWSMSRLSKLRF